jgi:ribosomal protein S18 acetylase RimI-like enzyme
VPVPRIYNLRNLPATTVVPAAAGTARPLITRSLRKLVVVQYRSFRNTDPPGLAAVWNEALPGRGAVCLRGSLPLESCVFAKPYFDPAGLVVAVEGDTCAGFGHAGFGADAAEEALSYRAGVTCVLAVRPAYRRRGVGSELLRRCEDYLRGRGAQALYAGPHRPLDPFYLGLYGGSELPGLLDSDAEARAFLLKRGYAARQATCVLQRRLSQPVRQLDPRTSALRQRFELQVDPPRASLSTWWQNCVLGLVDPLLFALYPYRPGPQGQGAIAAATALVYEMEGFSARWGQPTVGILNLQVRPELCRQGLGRFLLAQILRYVQDNCFELAEVQVADDNQAALRLCQSLGFTPVDMGRLYQRQG